jgi:tetratricopeptide (TPR) repeat protein
VPRTKMTRHQLKEQDEITTTLQTVTELLVAKKKEATMALGVVAALVVIFIGWSYYSSSRNTRSQIELSQAINTYNDTANIKSDKERYEKTIAEAQKTYDDYKSLPAGSIALYYVGLSQDGLGDTAKAVQSLQEAAQRGDASVKAVSQFALGSVYRKHGDFQKAIETYKQLYDGGGYSKAAVAYELASVYEANKQVDQAKEYYQKLVTDFPDSPFRQNADDALKRLGVTAPPPKPS